MTITIKEAYFKRFNIDLKEAERRNFYGDYRPVAVEMLGDAILKEYNIFPRMAKDGHCKIEKIEDKALQRKGIDYIVNNCKIDIKACCGPSYTKCPLEICQYGKPAYIGKETDMLLYILADWKGIRIVPYPFSCYVKFVDDVLKNPEAYDIKTSKNGTASYVSKELKDWFRIDHVI